MPPIKIQFVFFGFAFATFSPEMGREGISGKNACAGAIFGNGDPQFEQTELLPGFSTPQLSHLITFGCGGGACITRPASRAFASVRSPPHWEHVLAVAGLRVPQNGQWISAPSFAALMEASSSTNFCSAGRSNCTFSGCGAPQFSQVLTPPLLRVPQLGQVHSF